MKKRLYIALCISVMFILSTYIYGYAAEMNTYTIEEIGLSIRIPDTYAVIMRDVNEDNPNLSSFAFETKDEMLYFMNENNIYLDAFDKNSKNEIVVDMTDTSQVNFNDMSDYELLKVLDSLKLEYESDGMTHIKSEIYNNGKIKFLKTYISMLIDGGMVYELKYYTVYNSQSIHINLFYSSDPLAETIETEMKNIVDSADFNVGMQLSDLSTSSDGYEYIDSDTKLSFTVPENYTQQAFSEERDIIKAKFVNNERGVSILYGVSDVFGAIPEEDKIGVKRSDINHSEIPEEVLHEIYGTNEIEKVFYGNKEYDKEHVKQTDNSIGIELQIDQVVVTHFENGYMYIFQFIGRESSPDYADFEKLLESVKYPEYYDTDSSYLENYLKNFGLRVLLSIILTITIYSLPIIIYRYAIHRKPVTPSIAKKITIIYGIAAFLVMSLIILSLGGKSVGGTAIIFWSFVNYRMLISGYKKDIPYADSQELQIEKPKTKKISFDYTCPKCKHKFKVNYNMPEYKTVVPNLETVCPKCRTRQIIKSDEIVNTSLKQI